MAGFIAVDERVGMTATSGFVSTVAECLIDRLAGHDEEKSQLQRRLDMNLPGVSLHEFGADAAAAAVQVIRRDLMDYAEMRFASGPTDAFVRLSSLLRALIDVADAAKEVDSPVAMTDAVSRVAESILNSGRQVPVATVVGNLAAWARDFSDFYWYGPPDTDELDWHGAASFMVGGALYESATSKFGAEWPFDFTTRLEELRSRASIGEQAAASVLSDASGLREDRSKGNEIVADSGVSSSLDAWVVLDALAEHVNERGPESGDGPAILRRAARTVAETSELPTPSWASLVAAVTRAVFDG